MTHVAGIDPATKNLGLACPDGTLATINARADAKDPIRRLAELESGLYHALVNHPPRAVLWMVEGYMPHGPGGMARYRLGEVGGMVRTMGFRLGAEIVEVPVGSLKRFATGNGSAAKEAMVARAVELGAILSHPKNHDEADAFLLRHLGRMGAGDISPTTDHEAEVLAALRWPVLRGAA